jgi:hypothetical protein
MKIIFLFFLLVLMNNATKINNIYLKKEYAAILNFAPMLRVHDIIVFPDNGGIMTIDFTPINQSNPHVIMKLLIGKYVPAEVRIRKMATWNLTEWYSLSPIDVSDVVDIDLRNKITRVIDTWNHNNRGPGMNLYKRNCKHFSNFVIRNFLYSSKN